MSYEDLACGLPVVTTDVPANLEWVIDNENGRVVLKGGELELADAIVELLSDDDKRRNRGHSSLRIAQAQANWDENFARIESMYGEIMTEVTQRR